MKYILIAYLTAAFCIVACADEVRLTNGRTLVGIARDEEPNRVVVETRYGDLRFPKSEVESIQQGRTDLHEYRERYDGMAACPAAADLVELAAWAQDRGLVRYVNGLLTQAIEIDPENAEARSMLGYVKFEGSWMYPRERQAVLTARDKERRALSPRTVPVRRTRPKPEETPYSLGLPLQPSRSATDVYPPRSNNYGGYGGGYVMSIGGVTPGGDVVIPYPIRPSVATPAPGGGPYFR